MEDVIKLFLTSGSPLPERFQFPQDMKKFNLKIFKVAMVITILLTFVSWVGLEANAAENESHTFWWAVGSLWTLLRFPVFSLYWHFLYNQNNVFLFSIAVSLNCAFYGFVIERIISMRRKKPEYQTVSSAQN